jgi:4-diphosphocytidyl-2-C-methyl-D-erythritol kinase
VHKFPQTLRCPAKVNWTLKVGPKKASGLHRVETLMLALGLHDTLRLQLDPAVPKGSMALKIQGPASSADIPTDARNLVLRAATRVAELHATAYSELPCGLSFELDKQIPSQAGLGGGSSNAAAAAMCLLMGLDGEWCEADLLELLQDLGSDCPFFGHVLFHSHDPGQATNSALCFDQGQRVVRQVESAPALELCVLTPGEACPTGAIYSALQYSRGDLPEQPQPQSWGDLRAARCNDLEPAALEAVPELKAWREVLSDYDPSAFQLSGSGSSFYGVIPSGQDSGAWYAGLLQHLEARELKPRFQWLGPLSPVGLLES